MDDVTRVSAAKAAWDTSSDLDRRGTQQGFFRRAFRWIVHFLSYTFILSRPTIRTSYAAGFRLSVRPTVFHPKFFISSEKFASFLDTLDLTGKRVCEIGTGTGILALAAARAGAANVIATDINPNASLSANENAHANGLGDRVTGVCMNLMAAMAPQPLFDVILSSPPKHAGEPKDLTDRGWHAGPEYRDIKEMFDQARTRLKPEGRIYLMLSSDTNQELFASLIAKAGFSQRKIKEYSLVVESLIIFELLPR
ncbi:MAG TPA: 50S ribosomal protein L11 methyltransferase [Xanthobacteraceae bacterium]|jgi:release factor glutamine methyltransferase|nr:50S ribosomal protein L11 methyltransferase [Xanthobacteraceae bacterium]